MFSKKVVCLLVLGLTLATLAIGLEVPGMHCSPALRADGTIPPPPPIPIPWRLAINS
jgi:hypothetical protein